MEHIQYFNIFGYEMASNSSSPATVSPPPNQHAAAVREERIKRPMNSFLFWMPEARRKLHEENPKMTFDEASVILGERWRALDDETKAPFERLAEEGRRLHRQMYPGYKYHGNKKSAKKPKGAGKRRAPQRQEPVNVEALFGEAAPIPQPSTSRQPPPQPATRHPQPPPPAPAPAEQPPRPGTVVREFRIERRPVTIRVPPPPMPQPPQPTSRQQPPPQSAPQEVSPAAPPTESQPPSLPPGVRIVFDPDDWLEEEPLYVDESGNLVDVAAITQHHNSTPVPATPAPATIPTAAYPATQPATVHHSAPTSSRRGQKRPSGDRENVPPPPPPNYPLSQLDPGWAGFSVRQEPKTKRLVFDAATENFLSTNWTCDF